MPSFGKRSRGQLDTCNLQIETLMNEVVLTYDTSILEGHRVQELQDLYYEKGTSKLKYPDGNHNNKPSLAVDAQPYPFNPKGPKAKIKLAHWAGYVMATFDRLKRESPELYDGYQLRWGGDWDSDGDLDDQTFDDYYHFEIISE